jgi:AraC-like DNA-binding protein
VCDDWDSVLATCESQPVRVAIVDLFAGGRANFERVRQLKQRLPRLTMIAYVSVTSDRAHDLFDAGRQGMDGLVIAEEDDAPRALLAVVEQAESRSLAAVVRQSVQDADPTVRDAVLLCVTRAHERLSPEALARLLALPRRTVSQRLSIAGYPPPQRLITWGRLIVAAHLLEDKHRSADRIATSLDFPSGSAFRNACQRYLRATPGEIRARGGAAFVMAEMEKELGTVTTSARAPGSETPRASFDLRGTSRGPRS